MSWLKKRSVQDERMSRISEHWAKMFMWSSYKIGVYGIHIGLDILERLLRFLKVDLQWIVVRFDRLKMVFLVIDRDSHGGWRK